MAGKKLTMDDLESINFPHYYNLVKEGKMKAKEVKDLLFNGRNNRYDRYVRFLEGKPIRTEADRRKDKKRKRNKGKTPEQIKAEWKEKLKHMTEEDANKFFQKHMIRITKGDTVIIKRCTDCREYKMIQKFGKDKTYKDGINSICKECNGKRSKERYEANPDYTKKYQKEYYEAKVQQEIDRIKHNYTNLLYPHCGTQYGIIYKVQNIKNGKTYIGQTTKSFDLRYDGDFFTNKMKEVKNEELKADFYQDLEMFGVGAFMVQEVIDVAFSPMELDEKEVYWIDYYNAYEEGYNSNRGFYNGRTTVYNKWIEEHPEYEEYKNIFGVYLLEE